MIKSSQRALASVFRRTEEMNRARLLTLLEERKDGRLLDCGCGDGRFTLDIAKAARVQDIHGIEVVEERIAEASSRGVKVWKEDLDREWSLPDAYFDVVHANQVIEHLTETETFLKEALRVLRPGGFLLLSTNNLASWHSIFSLVLGFQPPAAHVSNQVILGNPLDPFRGHRFSSPTDSHKRLFTPRGLKEVARYLGFQVETVESVGWYPLPPFAARLANVVDPIHGAFLVAKLRRRPEGKA